MELLLVRRVVWSEPVAAAAAAPLHHGRIRQRPRHPLCRQGNRSSILYLYICTISLSLSQTFVS